MKRPFFLVTLAIILAGLVLFELSNTTISIADTNIPNSEVASGANKASHSSVSAVTTITMYTVASE